MRRRIIRWAEQFALHDWTLYIHYLSHAALTRHTGHSSYVAWCSTNAEYMQADLYFSASRVHDDQTGHEVVWHELRHVHFERELAGVRRLEGLIAPSKRAVYETALNAAVETMIERDVKMFAKCYRL